MKEYKKWLEKQIERCLEDKDLQKEHWAFCKAYEKLIEIDNKEYYLWCIENDMI